MRAGSTSPTIAMVMLAGHVVFVEELLGVLHAQVFDVAGPAAGHVAVGMGGDGGGEHLLHELALRIGFGAHAALFADHVALLIKLAVDGMEEAGGFEIEPELDAVGGEVVEVVGGILAGGGVHADAAVFLDDARVEVGDDVGIGLLDGFVELRLEGFEFFGIGVGEFVAFGVELIVDALDVVAERLFRRASWWCRWFRCL